ncbi:MAG TPA: hypothetical protein VGW38_06565, partial [Chloroflexota bacterium]|nr:hypothetical protein [Chloroflexota bacterium]
MPQNGERWKTNTEEREICRYSEANERNRQHGDEQQAVEKQHWTTRAMRQRAVNDNAIEHRQDGGLHRDATQ